MATLPEKPLTRSERYLAAIAGQGEAPEPVTRAEQYMGYIAENGTAGGGCNGEVYSTDETRIGTWIDGKPVYQQIFFGIVGAKGSSTTICTIEDIDKTLELTAVIERTDGIFVKVPDTFSAVSVSNGNVTIYNNYDYYTNAVATVIVKYTKTTDSATIDIAKSVTVPRYEITSRASDAEEYADA